MKFNLNLLILKVIISGMVLIITWQKITPLIIISYLNINKNSIFLIFLIPINSIFGLNQNSIRKILAISSINNTTWILFAILISEKLWLNYFIIYSLLNFLIIKTLNNYNINYLNQLKFFNLNFFLKLNLLIIIFSIIGLPPILGFLIKWILIKILIINNIYLTIIILILLTITNIIFYIKITYFILFNFNLLNKWYLQLKKNNLNLLIIINFSRLLTNYLIIY